MSPIWFKNQVGDIAIDRNRKGPNLNQKQKKQKIGNIVKCLYVVLILSILLVNATYTWFSLTRTPKLSDLYISIGSNTGMELAHDPLSEEWTQHLDMREVLQNMAPLKPVTWVHSEQCFYAAEFGIDGRISGITKKLSDDRNANRTDSEGYYIKHSFYAHTGTPTKVSLTPAKVGADGLEGYGTYLIGTPVWDGQAVLHENGGHGAEFAMRVGIRITKLDLQGAPTGETPLFYVYEPNYDGHAEGENSVVETFGLDGQTPLVPTEQLIRQTSSAWTEAYPVEKNVIVKELGDFTTDTYLFDLNAEEIAQIELYFWLEGQDIDCNNQIGQAAQIFANVQFSADVDNNSGLEKID